MFKGPGTRYHLFLKKAPTGSRWRLDSPTAGFAEVQADAKVVTTFRISIHQVSDDSNTYELIQTCIYKKLHREECSSDLYRYIVTHLSLEPPVTSSTASQD